jgi:uncharacterized protein YdaU (DUF1376 family)
MARAVAKVTALKSPAFQFYPKDYLTDMHVRAMSFAQRGLYWEAISICWLEGSLPNDPGELAAVLGCPAARLRALWPRIAPCFMVAGARLVHKRLDRERLSQAESRARRAAAANKRWQKEEALKLQATGGSQTKADAMQCPPSASASASPSSTPITKRAGAREPKLTRYATLGVR